MDRAEQLSLLGGFAADQWGLVTSAQAKDAGLNGVQLLRLAEAGLLESVAHGVYLVAAAGVPQHLEIKVAWLRLRPTVPAWERSADDPDSGVVSHASACQLHELGDIPAPQVEISVPRRRVTKDPSVRLRTAMVETADTTLIDGLPVTTARRTIVDLLSAKADGGHVGGVIAEADRRGLISIDELAEAAGPFARRYGMPRGSDGRALIEHLVLQAGESLRSDQLERASQAGFKSALLGLQQAIEAFSQSAGLGSVNDAALAAVADSLKLRPPVSPDVKLPMLIPPEVQRRLADAALPSPGFQHLAESIRKLQQDAAASRRDARSTPDEATPAARSSERADGDDHEP
ncbi:type IV toxin-antitoxin system AbiEi family antitoxin domain-containing protein [Streptomyces javensis]|uniref:Type IV toxin-antitoxin system AbiEi family antitoxin domain-containing protein n=1 Tax=Streptomyces javensis TaxID=114698 RepID=A0ABS0RHF8_9ACTN|nr:type IV toxin-antitoxin system AbiEi family antitoxin domain-containing protein [Streptomyces javensis]MBI0316874.1 type IV toxin-antitoxin system AbiEi family antitoxin domain-containing protein [Streptomyces javensis]